MNKYFTPKNSTYGVWFLLILFLTLFSENIIIYDGLGWDGNIYYQQIVEHHQNFTKHNFDAYYFHRAFIGWLFLGVQWLVNHLFQAPVITTTIPSVILFYKIINGIALFTCAPLWFSITAKLKYAFNTSLIGFILAYINFGVLKQCFYLPVNTDALQYFFMLLILHQYVHQKWIGLCLSMLLASFNYTLLPFVFGCCLMLPIIFPFSYLHPIIQKTKTSLSFLAWFICIGLIAYYISFPLHTISILSLIGTGVYVFTAIRFFANNQPQTEVPETRITQWKMHGLMVIGIFVLWAMDVHFTVPSTYLDSSKFLSNVFTQATKNFLPQFAAHFAYAGFIIPIFLVVVWLSPKRLTIYFPYAMLFMLVLGMSTETRQVAAGLIPLLTLSILSHPYFKHISAKSILLLGSINVLFSRVWFMLNPFKFHRCLTTDEFPAQWYFMNHGPWLWWPVAIGLIVLLAASVLICKRILATNHP